MDDDAANLNRFRPSFQRNIAYLHPETTITVSKELSKLKYFIDPIWTMPLEDVYHEYNRFIQIGYSRIIYLCSVVNISQCLVKIKKSTTVSEVESERFLVDFFSETCQQSFLPLYELLHKAFSNFDNSIFWYYDDVIKIYDLFIDFLICLRRLNDDNDRKNKHMMNTKINWEFEMRGDEMYYGNYFNRNKRRADSANVRVLFIFVTQQEHVFARIAGLRLAGFVCDPLAETHDTYEWSSRKVTKNNFTGIIDNIAHDIKAHGVFEKKNQITVEDEIEFESFSCFIESKNPLYMGFTHYFFTETEGGYECTKHNGNYESYLKTLFEFKCRYYTDCLYQFGSSYQTQTILTWMFKHFRDFHFKPFTINIGNQKVEYLNPDSVQITTSGNSIILNFSKFMKLLKESSIFRLGDYRYYVEEKGKLERDNKFLNSNVFYVILSTFRESIYLFWEDWGLRGIITDLESCKSHKDNIDMYMNSLVEKHLPTFRRIIPRFDYQTLNVDELMSDDKAAFDRYSRQPELDVILKIQDDEQLHQQILKEEHRHKMKAEARKKEEAQRQEEAQRRIKTYLANAEEIRKQAVKEEKARKEDLEKYWEARKQAEAEAQRGEKEKARKQAEAQRREEEKALKQQLEEEESPPQSSDQSPLSSDLRMAASKPVSTKKNDMKGNWRSTFRSFTRKITRLVRGSKLTDKYLQTFFINLCYQNAAVDGEDENKEEHAIKQIFKLSPFIQTFRQIYEEAEENNKLKQELHFEKQSLQKYVKINTTDRISNFKSEYFETANDAAGYTFQQFADDFSNYVFKKLNIETINFYCSSILEKLKTLSFISKHAYKRKRLNELQLLRDGLDYLSQISQNEFHEIIQRLTGTIETIKTQYNFFTRTTRKGGRRFVRIPQHQQNPTPAKLNTRKNPPGKTPTNSYQSFLKTQRTKAKLPPRTRSIFKATKATNKSKATILYTIHL